MVHYTNYKGDRYYLHEGISKKGNPIYWFSKSTMGKGKLAEKIPNGFEIYEEPNGMVYLWKNLPQIITVNEINIVQNSISKELDAKVYVKKNVITIYLFEGECVGYQALMRFILIDEKTRKFEAQRYCFRGSIDSWIGLDTNTDLKKLAKKCCHHLGKDSFYDLPYMVDGFL
ncbi:MAG TPA: hypothetical protein PK733_07620 [Clostridiales bacterium]|nr:hypothetical protein [Clostridiales bacterium]